MCACSDLVLDARLCQYFSGKKVNMWGGSGADGIERVLRPKDGRDANIRSIEEEGAGEGAGGGGGECDRLKVAYLSYIKPL